MESSGRDIDSGMFDASGQGLISRVYKGMRVIDSAGEEIGKVEIVKMGDPALATGDEDADRKGSMVEGIAGAFGYESEPDAPAQLRAHMMRVGFLKIDAKGLFASDRYVTPDKIASVANDTVSLNVRKDQMVDEA